MSRGKRKRSALAIAMAVLCLTPIAAHAGKGQYGVGSVNPPNLPTFDASMSADGRWVAFVSAATNLTEPPTETYGIPQVWVLDRTLKIISLVSTNKDGAPADAAATKPKISDDGRYVVFLSAATNLTGLQTHGKTQAYRRNRGEARDDGSGTSYYVDEHPSIDQGRTSTDLVSVNTDLNDSARADVSDPAISGDGLTYAFATVPTGFDDVNSAFEQVFVRDAAHGATALVSTGVNGKANGDSSHPSLSRDGRLVAFQSRAWNLTGGAQSLGDPTDSNKLADIFVHDRKSGTCTAPDQTQQGCTSTQRVSLGPLDPVSRQDLESNGDSTDPVITPDGSMVVFTSLANDLVFANAPAGVLPADPIPVDLNQTTDVYLRDIAHSVTELISVATSGDAAGNSSEATISSTGQLERFSSTCACQQGVIDVQASELLPAGADRPSPFVAFYSTASDIVAGDNNGVGDVFVADVTGHVKDRISVDAGGNEALGESSLPSISADGRLVAFQSEANLTGIPTKDWNPPNVYVTDRYVCSAGPKTGPVSGPLDTDGGPLAGPLRGEVDDLNCQVVAGHGL